MCGIAGFIQRKGTAPETELLAFSERMSRRISHRGPDGAGSWRGESRGWETWLGHRRLSIIDLEGGHQPLGTADEAFQITFNGEIYNYQELREPLRAKSHVFRTASDTEVLLHHFREYGISGLSKLNGMFAFAIWNSREGELTLARDRAGIKPLFYASLSDGGLVFASELTAILEHPGISRRLSSAALASYFFTDYLPGSQCLVHGVRKLEPGHWIRWRAGVLSEPAAYWSLREITENPEMKRSEGELSEELLRVLGSSVRRQLIADVPVGVFLSGGIDSSMIAALAQQQKKEPIQTFSIAFEDPTYDESAFARLVASRIGSRHTEETLSENILIDTAGTVLSLLDEPMADPSLIPTYLLSRLASRHVKVALGGDGGDELWAGYPTYRAHQLAAFYGQVPRILRDSLIKPLVSALPVDDRYQSLEWKAKRFALRWDDDALRRHMRWMSNTDLEDLGSLFPASLAENVFSVLPAAHGIDPLNRLLALDFQTYLPGSVLTKVDRASMANGLEVRPPFLDNESIRWAFGTPGSFKLRGGSGKYLLKKAARGLIPPEVIDRPKKGFGIPLARWLKGPLKPLAQAALKDSPLWSCGVRREVFSNWCDEHWENRLDRSKPIWALIVLDHWMKKERIHGID